MSLPILVDSRRISSIVGVILLVLELPAYTPAYCAPWAADVNLHQLRTLAHVRIKCCRHGGIRVFPRGSARPSSMARSVISWTLSGCEAERSICSAASWYDI